MQDLSQNRKTPNKKDQGAAALWLLPKNELGGDEMKDSEKVEYMEHELRKLQNKLQKTRSKMTETNQKISFAEAEIEKLHFLKETLVIKCGIWEEVIDRLCSVLVETEMMIEGSATKPEDLK